MKKSVNKLLLLAVLVAIMTACNRSDKNAMLIPRDAAFALQVNTKSLSGKLSWDEIKQTSWFQNVKTSPGDSLSKMIMEDPSKTGIDSDAGFGVFARRASSSKGYIGFTGTISDQAAFEAFNKKISQNAATTANGDIKSVKLNDKVIVSWLGSKFLYLVDAPFFSFNKSLMPGMPDSNYQYQEPAPLDLPAAARAIFNYKNDSLLASDDRYESLIKEDGDVHFWFNAEEAYGNSGSLGFMSMLKLEVYIKGSVTASTLNFDKGKISVHSHSYGNKEMNELFRRYGGTNINTDLIKRIPSDSVVAVFALNYKPEGLKEALKLGGLDGMLNGILSQMQITLDDFIAANKGEMLFAVSDIANSDPSSAIKVPKMKYIFVNAIGNRAAFDKLVATGKKLSEEHGASPSVFYNINNDLFALGNNQEMVDAYLKGGSHDQPFISKINGHPFGAYIDLNRIIKEFASKSGDTTDQQFVNSTLQTWKDIVVTGGEFKDDAVQANYEINFVDQNTNSLKQLNSYIDRLAAYKKKPN